MNTKPVLGLIAVAKKNQYKEEIYRLIDYYKTKLAGESSFEAIIENTVLFDESDIVHCAMEMEKKNVDLEKPDKIIKVEIIKDKAAISLLKPDELLKVAQL